MGYWIGQDPWQDIRGTAMGKPISADLRERIVTARERGGTLREVGERFGVAASTVRNLALLQRETGAIDPRKMGGDRRSHGIEAHKERLLELVAVTPDVTIDEVRRVLLGVGMNASTGVIWRFYDRYGFSFKKKPRMRQSKNGQM